jgi:BON domain
MSTLAPPGLPEQAVSVQTSCVPLHASHTLAAIRAVQLEPDVREDLRLAAQTTAAPQAGRGNQLEAASNLAQSLHSPLNIANNLEHLLFGSKLISMVRKDRILTQCHYSDISLMDDSRIRLSLVPPKTNAQNRVIGLIRRYDGQKWPQYQRYGRNIKIFTQDGKVTLRGPVRSEEEKGNLEAKAVSVAGQENVSNQLAVAPSK